MNMQLLFDRLSYVDRLRHAGIADDVARAHADGLEQAFKEEVATKNDLNDVKTELKTELKAVETRLTIEISDVRSELKAEIAEVKSELKAEIAEVKSDLLKMMLYQTGLIVTILGGLGAIFKFL